MLLFDLLQLWEAISGLVYCYWHYSHLAHTYSYWFASEWGKSIFFSADSTPPSPFYTNTSPSHILQNRHRHSKLLYFTDIALFSSTHTNPNTLFHFMTFQRIELVQVRTYGWCGYGSGMCTQYSTLTFTFLLKICLLFSALSLSCFHSFLSFSLSKFNKDNVKRRRRMNRPNILRLK